MQDSPIWAITSYFTLDDPKGFRQRLQNFKQFRKRLAVPLLTVEFSPDDSPFDLSRDDSDLLLQIRGGSVLWQKERLLNLALGVLPPSCESIVWVDSDVVFQRSDWPQAARKALQKSNFIQLFRRLRFLKQGVLPEDTMGLEQSPLFDSIAWAWIQGAVSQEALESTAITGRYGWTPGFAWGAKREILEHSHFYDALILGGGDKAMFYAACGAASALVKGQAMSPKQRNHYLTWADRFTELVDRKIAYLEGEALHLWHGDLSKRGYDSRYQAFEQFDFDPDLDIRIGPSGAWYWACDKPELRQRAHDFFQGRQAI